MQGETKFTPGPWEFVPGSEHHGPYVSAPWGDDICDLYFMSDPSAPSVRNGGPSRPIWFHAEQANANAALIAAAPDLYAALETLLGHCELANEGRGASLVDPHSIRAARAALSRARGEAQGADDGE